MVRTRTTRLAATVIGGALLFGACSSSDDTATTGATATQTSLSSSEQWAETTCGAITTWQTDVLAIATGLRGSLRATGTTTDVASRGEQLEQANQRLLDTLQGAGIPETEAGAQIRAQVESLQGRLDESRTELDTAVAAIQNASGAAAVATAIGDAATTVGSILTELDTTITAIEGLSPTDELRTAVDESAACQALQSSSERRTTDGTTGS